MCLEVENNTKLNEFNTNSKKGPWMVWYYAKWCGHCSDMVPEWSKLGENNVHNVNLAKVSEEFIPKVKCDTPVQGYPTIVLYKNGNVLGVHSGDRSADSFNDYIKNNINAKPQVNNNSGINTNDNADADADVDADADADPEPDTGVNSGLNSLLNLFTKKNTGVVEPEKKKKKKKRKKKASSTKKKKAATPPKKKKASSPKKKKPASPKKKKATKKKKKTSNNNNNNNTNNNNINNNSALMPNSM